MNEILILEPAKEFIDSLSIKMQAKTFRSIDLLQEFGFTLTMPHSKKLTGYDLYELRVKFASDIVRMFYYTHNGKIFIISSGYIKKTNKTSKREIEKAISIINRHLQEAEDESI